MSLCLHSVLVCRGRIRPLLLFLISDFISFNNDMKSLRTEDVFLLHKQIIFAEMPIYSM